ncbi:MAG: glycosyltransferase [Planctomycetota bacterium]|nr:MAG: glycosyltransferase [Planctomycetota bacterium]
MPAPDLSVVIASHNRCDVVLHTLDQLRERTRGVRAEIIVVDNRSTDGTPDALRRRGDVTLLELSENLGSCAKALGAEVARAPLLLFLDDDSYPRAACVETMIECFDRDPDLGAAGFTVHLPNGAQECSALPHVFVGCGVGLRAAALRDVGGLDSSFFMQAEEYDLALRLLGAGWGVEIFADLEVDHLKTPHARRSARTTYYDIRNNLRVVARYLPDEFAAVYRGDWLLRYEWLARRLDATARGENHGAEGEAPVAPASVITREAVHAGADDSVDGDLDGEHLTAFRRGAADGDRLALSDRRAFRTRRMTRGQLEPVFQWEEIEERMRRLATSGVRRIVFADFGKNIYAFLRGAQRADLDVAAVADDAWSAVGRQYRGVPILPTSQALTSRPDAIVVSNTSSVQAQRGLEALAAAGSPPVYAWHATPRSTMQPLSL